MKNYTISNLVKFKLNKGWGYVEREDGGLDLIELFPMEYFCHKMVESNLLQRKVFLRLYLTFFSISMRTSFWKVAEIIYFVLFLFIMIFIVKTSLTIESLTLCSWLILDIDLRLFCFCFGKKIHQANRNSVSQICLFVHRFRR